MPFTKREGGFTTPAAAIAILLVCALVFICARGAVIGSRSGQIQYVADAGALAADNAVAEFVTIGQVVDAALLSMSLLAVCAYGISAVAAFIPGGQAAATEIAAVGAKIFQARDTFAKSAIKGLNAAQKALPAICAVRAAQAVQANASASGIEYRGIALTSPMQGVNVELPDDTEAQEATKKIADKEESVQKQAVAQKQAQDDEDDAKRRAWLADCGNNGMTMYERAGALSSISGARNPYYSSPDNWNFQIPIDRAVAYYAARYASEPGAYAGGSPESVGESVARKRFYAYAQDAVAKGYVETRESGVQIPHLTELIANTDGVRGTWLYTESIYPVSRNGDVLYLHAYSGCPCYCEGEGAGSASVSAIDSGAVSKCPTCNYSATTLGRVPNPSTAIANGFEHHYREVVRASRDYADAVERNAQAKRELKEARDEIGGLLSNAVKSLVGKRYDPQPPGRYGCVCIVLAPSAQLQQTPFMKDEASIPARVAISGATLAPDAADDQGNVVTSIAEGLVPGDGLGSGAAKMIFGAWGSMLAAYSNGTNGIKTGFRKMLGAIPVVGTTISEQAASAFEGALKTAGLEPADLKTYKPVLVNTSQIIKRDNSAAASALTRLKQGASIYGAASIEDLKTLASNIEAVPEIGEFLDEKGLTIATISFSELGLGNGKGGLILPVPKDLAARLEQVKGAFAR